MKIGIIGGGWYGGHTARVLAKEGDDVTILEAGPHIFGRVSGMFGIRDHAGPHYPRSPKTRESCRRGAAEFDVLYPDLIIEHQYSIYGLGARDSSGMPSKVTPEQFQRVCEESKGCRPINPKAWGFNNQAMIVAFDVHEPSIAVGKKLRETWERFLEEDNIKVRCNYLVKKIEKREGKVVINDELEFDAIVNATSFQSFVPQKPLPFKIDIKYQVCLALVYEDLKSMPAPFSVIVMDGEFPCLMPYDDRTEGEEDLNRNYIMTHGKWTIMCSLDTPEEARALLNKITDRFIEKKVKPRCEQHMMEFWPKFSERFRYKGWKGNVLAKIRSDAEFRSAVTFADENMVHIIPGKVTNVVDAARETSALLRGQNVLTDGNYRYTQGGVLDEALHEIKSVITVRNTCDLQTYRELESLPELGDDPVPSSDKEIVGNVVSITTARSSRNIGSVPSAPLPIPTSADKKPAITSLPNSFTAPPPASDKRRMSAEF